MLSSLLRPKKHRQRVEEHSPFSSVYPVDSSPIVARQERQVRHATADWTETEAEDDNSEGDDDGEDIDEDGVDREAGDEEEGEEEEEDQDEDEDGEEDTPLLPIFSAAHLGN